MRFQRISITKSQVSLDWTTQDAGEIEHKLTTADKPLPSFSAALQAFSGFALSLIGAPKEWDERIKVTTLNFHEDKTKRRGLQVSFNHPVDRARGAAVSITTPTLWESEDPSAGPADGFYGDTVVALIEAAEHEATRFQKGERSQAEMFDKTAMGGEATEQPAERRTRGAGKKTPALV